MPTPQAFWHRDKMINFSRPSPFGPTLKLLTEDHGAAVLTSFLAAFPVRTSPSLDLEQASPASAPASGNTSPASFAKYCPFTSSWRTHQLSLLAVWEPYSETWPRWGTMQTGESSQLKTPSGLIALRASIQRAEPYFQAPPFSTKENASGFLPGTEKVPTPRLGDSERNGSPIQDHWNRSIISNWLRDYVQTQRVPTPSATDGNRAGTITQNMSGTSLPQFIKTEMLASPTARDWKSGKASPATMARNSRPLSEQVGGQLNPNWVEWLMGWPIGWTASEPLATAKFHQWQHSLGSLCSPASSAGMTNNE